ncbi:Alpha/Beta hydrolase protein [Lenzites betulinus]|nr:Alpha/Beta hydrolase protein [Lenzites betulinus]
MAYNHYAEPDPELAPLLAVAHPLPEDLTGDINAMREFLNTSQLGYSRRMMKPDLPKDGLLHIEDRQVEVKGGEIPIRCYWPTIESGSDKTFPVFVWMHGGGWVFPGIESDDYLMRILSNALQLAIVNVGYRLAPENPWPIPNDDSYAAVKWAAANMDVLHGDASKGFLIGGISAGAHMAGSITHRVLSDPFFKDHPKPTGQVLQIPPLVHPEAVPEEYKANVTSMEQNKDAPMLNKEQSYHFYGLVQAPPFDPDFSPLLYPIEQFKELPPVYMQVAGLDPVRDLGLVYIEKLKLAGVPSKLDVYPGAPHGFHLIYQETKVAKKFQSDLRDGIRWLLARPSATE